MELIRARCFNHAAREAAARCPECGHDYCRECVTEHEDRVVCAACLKKLTAPARPARRRVAGLGRVALAGAGLFTIWLFFYLVGQLLLAIPVKYHDGTVWHRLDREADNYSALSLPPPRGKARMGGHPHPVPPPSRGRGETRVE